MAGSGRRRAEAASAASPPPLVIGRACGVLKQGAGVAVGWSAVPAVVDAQDWVADREESPGEIGVQMKGERATTPH